MQSGADAQVLVHDMAELQNQSASMENVHASAGVESPRWAPSVMQHFLPVLVSQEDVFCSLAARLCCYCHPSTKHDASVTLAPLSTCFLPGMLAF